MSPASTQLLTVIIGCGDIAGDYDSRSVGSSVLSHAGAYHADGRFRIVACVEPDAARRQAFMERWAIPSGYAELSDCLAEQTNLDVASICSPTNTHELVLENLLDSSAQIIFCEKPMTGNPTQSEKLCQAYKASNKQICVNYLRRWDREMTILRDELGAGNWGAVRKVTAFYTKGLFHTGSHVLDLVQFLLGPLTPRLALRQIEDYSDKDPTVDAMLTGPDDIPVNLLGGDARDYARLEVEISCEHGVICIEDSGFRLRRRHTEDHRLFPGRIHLGAGTVIDTELDKALVGAVDNIHGAAKNGTYLISNADTALSVERLCQKILQLPLQFPTNRETT